jgi:molybdenum cofactor synthesis domain-containing protein
MTENDAARNATFSDAVRTWTARLEEAGCPHRLGSETLPLRDAVGRVPAQVARTKHPCPTYRAAAMDGYAVRSRDVESARAENPVRLRLGKDVIPVDTGNVVPAEFDAVIALEKTLLASKNKSITVSSAVAPGKNIRLPGDDAPPGVAVGWPGTALRPLDCATLAASGCTSVEVTIRPRLAVIPTGDEIVAQGTVPPPGSVIESNSLMIAAEAEAAGALATIWPITKDDDAALDRVLREALEGSDVVALIAGSSRGRRDRGAAAIERAGTIDVRGVATRPARPVVLGHAGTVPIVNLPGYPVSCHFAFDAYVAPLLRRLAGISDPMPRRARLGEAVETNGAFDEWRLATLLTAPGSPRSVAVPLADVGGSLYQLAQADARFHLKRGIARFGRYAAVPWSPLRDADSPARPLFVGPYDPLLEEMAALGGFRCRWTDDETGEALDAGEADAIGVIVRGGDLAALRKRAGEGRKMLPVGARSEGKAVAAAVDHQGKSRVSTQSEPGKQLGDPWAGAAAVAAGTRDSAPCTRYVAERFGVRFEEGDPAFYAVVWEDRPGHRFPWGIVLAAALSALADVAPALGWKNIGAPVEVTR